MSISNQAKYSCSDDAEIMMCSQGDDSEITMSSQGRRKRKKDVPNNRPCVDEIMISDDHSKKANSSSHNAEIMMCSRARRKKRKVPSNRLYVDEIMSDDDSVVMLPLETMQRLQLSHSDPVWIKGKKGRQTFCMAIAHDTNNEPKIRLNSIVRNDLLVRIGDFVSVHRCSDVKYGEPDQILSSDDNLKVSEFLNNARDEILFEIFLRLPNGQSALQYSSVCKRWYSIICNSIFIRSFIQIHDHICPPFSDDYYCSRPFTLLFRRDERKFYMGEDNDPHYLEPFCQVISEKVHHGKVPSDFLSFLPCPVAILASFDDLVVATSTEYGPLHGATDNYICNPLTKQWLALPKVIPPVNNAGYAFVREPTSCNKQLGFTSNARYRFVMIGHAHSDSRFELGVGGRHFCMENEFVTKVFCSEIGQWREYVITFPQHEAVIPTPIWGASRNPDLRIVTNNGILYWLEGLPLRGIVAFDPFSDIYTNHCRFIRLPVVFFNKTVHATDGKVCLGVVKGQLRLSQFYHAKAQPYFVFKVWELRNHDSESPVWALVYNLKLNTSEKNVYMLSFHPNNTNVVFLLYGNDICRYIISEKKYEKVGDYPLKVDNPCADISSYTIVYPPWPTPMFTLPSKGVNEDSSAEKGLAHNKEDVDDLLL